MPSSGIALLAHSNRHPPDDWLPNPRLLPDDGIFKSGPSPGMPGWSNRRRDRGAALGKLRNCLHQGAPLSWVLLELMATERASRCSWIRRWSQFGDQPQYLGEQHSWHGDLSHLERNVAVGRKNPIWRFRSMKLGDKLFLRPLRRGVDRCINGWQGRSQASLGREPRWSPRTYAFASSSSSFSVGTLGHG